MSKSSNNRGLTYTIGVYRLGDILGSSRVLAVGKYFSIKPKKGELKQILVTYDKKKSEVGNNLTLSYDSNTLELEKEDAEAYINQQDTEIISQKAILGYDGLDVVQTIPKSDGDDDFVASVVESIFFDLRNAVLEKEGDGEELEKLKKATKNLIKALNKKDAEKVVVSLGMLEIIDLDVYYDKSIGEEENMEDAYERKFYRSVSFYTLLATRKISESKKNMKDVKVIGYSGQKEKYVQIFLGSLHLLE